MSSHMKIYWSRVAATGITVGIVAGLADVLQLGSIGLGLIIGVCVTLLVNHVWPLMGP